ncbi:flagellar type III secretion system protein FliR [Jejubacter calystegiae]|uniref:Flagellar biosynthetic protein FliR n=1 Tax=Jejubacter calystegiae TaxID=2579935 RepID=A0A4P8YNY4_9ENTR|nr:flagellar biosynthetic protein FliR [Jejubacter calystegiae]QCT22605.1 flagellar type III secretion system protein FliR [Jejubacter calystegiae]
MYQVDISQIGALISHYFWPSVRVLALFTTAPIISEKQITTRVKIGLAMLISFLIAPSLPPVKVDIVTVSGLWLALQQILIGAAIGLTMQMIFAAVRTAGEIIGLQMGLSFATFVDPSGGPNMPVLARLLNVLMILLFLAFNGHLWMISILADSFTVIPIGPEPLNGHGFLAIVKTGGIIFSHGLMLGLPIITLLLTLNITLGLLNRLTPQLSIFVVGFPLTLTVGMVAMSLLIYTLAPFAEYLISDVFERLTQIMGDIG